jgi:DNA-binding PadR family transcriptional regulator
VNPLPQLSLPEWIVLALIVDGPKHGFAIATLTGEDGEVGRVWQVPRPIVYRAVARLLELDLVHVEATELGNRGPRRSVLAVDSAGSSAARAWLDLPVAHAREVRSELLVKLALISRRGEDISALIEAQRAIFEPMLTSLQVRQRREVGFEQVLATWRTESLRAVVRFLDELADRGEPQLQR